MLLAMGTWVRLTDVLLIWNGNGSRKVKASACYFTVDLFQLNFCSMPLMKIATQRVLSRVLVDDSVYLKGRVVYGHLKAMGSVTNI